MVLFLSYSNHISVHPILTISDRDSFTHSLNALLAPIFHVTAPSAQEQDLLVALSSAAEHTAEVACVVRVLEERTFAEEDIEEYGHQLCDLGDYVEVSDVVVFCL